MLMNKIPQTVFLIFENKNLIKSLIKHMIWIQPDRVAYFFINLLVECSIISTSAGL